MKEFPEILQHAYEKDKLTIFFPMLPFNPLENVRKPKLFLTFSGKSKRSIGKKRVKLEIFNSCNALKGRI